MRRGSLNLFLVGPMGAGKSTIGKELAKILNLDFIDTDKVIEDRTGADIAWIFDVEGEEGFREREIAVIAELTQLKGLVLATGGGAILAPENRNNLAGRGTVIYLKTTVVQLMKRTEKDKKRPLLQKMKDQKVEIQEMLDDRETLYAEISDIVIETDERTVKSVATEIVKALQQINIA